MIHDRELRFAIVIPKDLFPEKSFGIRLKTLSDPRNEIETQTVNGLLQKTIFSNVPDLLGQSLQARAKDFIGPAQLDKFNGTLATTIAATFGGDADTIRRSIAAGDFGLSALSSGTGLPTRDSANATGQETRATSANAIADIVKIENEQIVGKQVKSPEATRIIAGQAIMFLLFAISGSAAGFFDEKNAGLFQRLLSAPVTRAHLLWSRFLFGVLLGIVQLVTLFVTGSLLYGIDVLSHAGNLLVVSACAAAAAASFGMLIAALAPNSQAASGLATFVILMMSALGGAWFPVAFMPELMQQVAKFTLVYWSIEGFLQVLWAGNTFVELLPILGILLAIAAGVMAFSIWRLNRKQMFG
jgi:ABC-2 type transport system permease protein